jgi:peptide/nickel transport system permease protein
MRRRLAAIGRAGRQEPVAVAGVGVLALAVLLALLAPLIAPYDTGQSVGPGFAPPSGSHPLGLDDVGADILSLLIWGARTSLLIGFLAAAFAVTIGAIVGLAAGYFGRAVETVLVGVTDYFLVVPVLPLAIVAAALWGPSLRNEIVIIALLSWPITARTVRAQVKSVRSRTYIARVKSLGASDLRVIGRHILPSVGPLLMASAVICVGNAIFFEAALSFLGLGDTSQTSWGKMIADAFSRGAVGADAWWAVVPPGIAIGIVVLATSMVGRAVEDRLNPRLGVSHLGSRSFEVRRRPAAGDAA